jgi:hypothetical protein
VAEETLGAPVGMAAEHTRVAFRTKRLLDAVRDVTLEEFRSEDALFERHSRLGRELLFLVANNSWCRRTTEVVEVRQAQAIDTDVIVDVDLAYADHEAFERDAGITWLPLLALPPMLPVEDDVQPGGWAAWRPSVRRRLRANRNQEEPDQITSLEVSDAAGTRVHKLPQAEVHQRLAAALAEIILNVMASRAQQAHPDPASDPLAGLQSPSQDGSGGSTGMMEREDKLLLSAAIRRLLPGRSERPSARGGTVPAGVREARRRLDSVLSQDIYLAETAAARAQRNALSDLLPAVQGLDPYDDTDQYDDDATGGIGGIGGISGESTGRLRPVLGAHVGEILDALIGTTFVVVAVEDPGHPISYTINVPSRRLVRLGGSSMWFQPRALLSIDLLAPTAHADRLIRLVLPDGVVCHDGSAGALGRIDVVLPAPFERLDTLMRRLFPPSLPTDRPASWVDSRIAEMALHTVDATLDSLRHYAVTATRSVQATDLPRTPGPGRTPVRAGRRRGPTPPSVDELTALVDKKLRQLREQLAAVRRSRAQDVRMDELCACWDDGAWFPAQIRRRLGVNTASTNLVLMRASAIEDVTLRARPTVARIDADVSVFDSPVFNVARYAGAMNMTVLAVLTALLVWDRSDAAVLQQRELLATILTLFSAVQASRVEHPDGSTMRGLLSKASYWIMLGSVLPTVLLAMALAVVPPEHCWRAAVIALVVQGLLTLRLRRGPLSRWRRNAPPRITLATGHAPDHARVDVLRGKRSRALLADALMLGREAYAYVVSRPAGQGQFLGLLELTQSNGSRVEERIGRVTARATRMLANRGIDVSLGGAAGQANGHATSGRAVAANLLGVVQSATAGRAMTYLVFRERPSAGWFAADTEPGVVVSTVPLDPDRLAPMEPPEWVLEVLVGIPESAVAIPLVEHPLLAIVTATQRYNFRVIGVQLPAPPPPGGTGRRWLRLRVGVSYRRGDSLRGLGTFLYRLHGMDNSRCGDGTLSVIVRVNADQSATPRMAVSRPLSDKDFDVVPDDEAAGEPYRHWRTLALTAHSRIGLLHDILVGLAAEAPSFELAGLTVAPVYGQTVLFLVGRDLSPSDRDARLPEALPRRVRPSDRLLVAVDQRLTARNLDGPAVVNDQLLLRVSLRTPDRPGVLRDTLRTLTTVLAEHAPAEVEINGLDVWFVLLQVVNGRSTRGRLTIRLPGPPALWPRWQKIDWAAVERSVGRSPALAAGADGLVSGPVGWSTLAFDDTVITTELLRTAVPAPLTPPVPTA